MSNLLHKGNYLALHETHDGYEYVEEEEPFKVAVLPYRYTPEGSLQVLARFEPQPQHDVEIFLTCITGDRGKDENIGASADRELLEESGIDRKLESRECFVPIGRINQSKNSTTQYTVMICELPFKNAPTKIIGPGDGSKWEKDAFCSWASPYHIKETCHCSVMLSALYKLEHYLEKLKRMGEDGE